ncbi:unnamed protein product, partial [Owenia fusiformis]
TVQYINDYFHKIDTNLHSKVYFRHVKTYIAVDNKSDDDPELNRLKKTIVQLAEGQGFWGQKVPIKWLLLEKHLRGLKVESEDREPVRFLKFEEVKAIGLREEMDQASVTACLEFYHSVGDMIFFNENNLCDLVILDPQWLIDVFKSVITVPKFDIDSSEQSESERTVWEILDKDGVIMEKSIETVWKDRYAKLSIPSDVMIDIMQRFDLICPFGNNQRSFQEKRQFFVPCLLPKPEPSDVIKNKPLAVGTLFYTFSFLPKGLFHRLVAKICQENKWSLHGKLYFDYAVFKVTDQLHVLTLLAEENYLELKIHQLLKERTNRRQNSDMCLTIREDIEAILKSAIKIYCPSVSFKASVRCRCLNIQEGQKLVPISTDEINRGHKLCDFHTNCEAIDLQDYKPWFQMMEGNYGKCIETKV